MALSIAAAAALLLPLISCVNLNASNFPRNIPHGQRSFTSNYGIKMPTCDVQAGTFLTFTHDRHVCFAGSIPPPLGQETTARPKIQHTHAIDEPMPPEATGVLPTKPWTEEPDCVRASDGSNKVYCIYTSSTFAEGRGISLITTPEVAAHMTRMPAFTQPEALEGVGDVVSNKPYVPQSIPGRGVGLVANRTLHRGDNIFSYTPLLVVKHTTLGHLEDDVRLAMQNRAVGLLPESSRKLYLGLFGHFGGDKVNDIIFTNAFQVHLGEDEEPHYALLPEAARINHDCRPNADYYFDTNILTQHVFASRTIFPGEELGISYTNMMRSRVQRQAALQSYWGFECTCSLCSLPEALARESDKRLQLISELETLLDDWSKNTTAAPQMAEALISLYHQERLYSTMTKPYTYAALAFSAAGDEYIALKYAALAVEHGTMESGPEDLDVLTMQEFMEDPKSHWSWMSRL